MAKIPIFQGAHKRSNVENAYLYRGVLYWYCRARNQGANDFVMICLYSLLMVVAAFGWSTVAHHRVRQKEKFAFIKGDLEKFSFSARFVDSW